MQEGRIVESGTHEQLVAPGFTARSGRLSPVGARLPRAS